MSVLPSAKSMRTVNPIREVVENIVHKDPANEITLALGLCGCFFSFSLTLFPFCIHR